MGDILIKDGFIATMDRDRKVYKSGDLYIDDGKIVSIGKDVEAPRSPEYTMDARNQVVMPGFVNVHTHLQQYFRGVYELIGDFYSVNLPLEGYRRPEDMEWLGLASCAEFIQGGSTTAMLIYTYPDGFAKAVEEAGNRMIMGADIEEVDLNRLKGGVYEYLPEKSEAAYKRAVDLHRNWEGGNNGLITTIMAPKAADLAEPETYLKCKGYAEEHGLKVTTHLSQSWREVQQVERLYGKTPPQHLHDLGILDEKLTGAHCTYATEKDTQMIAESGMGILHCRSVRNPLTRWMDLGIPVGLGTDDYFHDMLQLLRENITGQGARARAVGGSIGMRAGNRLTRRPSFYDLLELATRRGAEVLGIDDKVGSLEEGKRADIIMIDMMNPFLTPTKDPLTSIVLYGTSSDIDTVIVDGRILKRDGALTTIDTAEALLKGQERVEEIIERFFEENPEQRKNWHKMVPYME
ncbi:amidohydrolase family protein [Candidatus Bathyarchaeota archaeon]|nr:amidohydrolase family protein [Candidatus Bathyarchaeota archaeon]MBL7168053.1 amidohydrolase family protein [Candidatus Bathyarchaeota archaeon]